MNKGFMLLSGGLTNKQVMNIVIFSLVLILFIIICKWIIDAKKKKRMKDYRKITRGMSEGQMFSIMGGRFSRSLLKDDSIA